MDTINFVTQELKKITLPFNLLKTKYRKSVNGETLIIYIISQYVVEVILESIHNNLWY